MKLLVFLLLFSTSLSSKTHLIWNINKDHSSAKFEVDYLSFSKIDGQFKNFWGRAYFDEDGELPRKIEFSVDPSSVDTGSRIRDGHLRSSDFFNAKKFPTIRFQSKKILAEKPGEFLVSGDLYLKNKITTQSFLIKLSKLVKDTWGYENRFINFEFTLSRKELGLDWNRGLKGNELLVGDKVKFKGSLQMQPLNKLTPPSKHMIPTMDDKKTIGPTNLPAVVKTQMVSKTREVSKASEVFVTKVKPDVLKNRNYPLILGILILIGFAYFGLHQLKHQLEKSNFSERLIGLSLYSLILVLVWSIYTVSKVIL